MRTQDAQNIRRGIIMAKDAIAHWGNDLPKYHLQSMRRIYASVEPETLNAYARIIGRAIKALRLQQQERHRVNVISKINGDMDGNDT